MNWLDTIKDWSWGGNSGYDYFLALAIFVGLLIVLKLFQMIILARLRKLAERTQTDLDDVLIEIFTKIKPPLYFLISLYFGIRVLTLPDLVNTIAKIFFLLVVVYEVIRALEKLIAYSVQKYLNRTADDKNKKLNETTVKSLLVVLRIILWLLGLTLILANLGINVTSLIAGLGVGGIAIALALQNILGDIFSSFSIIIDKPFEIGDFIIVGTAKGTVEKIGLKTTRIRSIGGEELVISNKELTTAWVQNYGRLARRRIDFELAVVYGTDQAKLASIPKLIEQIISQHDLVEFDRCHFVKFDDYALKFETVYYVNSSDFNVNMDLKQAINLAIYQKFQEEGIGFAYPTQKVLLQK
ncbi:mechanosensitive ion channel family protein [Patescibacteria group bacterium]|nr:mechanosensitive ion channel family protein [Patescibacteria group bacterium]